MRPGPPPIRKRASRRRPSTGRSAIIIALALALSGAIGALAFFMPVLAVTQQATGRTADLPAGHASLPPPGQPFTILLLGSDNDAKFQSESVLTQSMILVRVDPAGGHVTMLSIPRDLWVPLSTGGYAKIDAAYARGGPQAAITTVETNLHIHIDQYAWVGLKGLIAIIDRLGGVDLVTTNPVLDDYYPQDLVGGDPYGYTRVAVLPGPQHLDGFHALQYVRSRHDDIRGDFGRSQRQQQVLLALREKARFISPLALPDLATSLSGELKTSMTLEQIRALLPLAQHLDPTAVKQVVLLPPATSGAWIAGQDVLLPDWSVILPIVRQSFPAA